LLIHTQEGAINLLDLRFEVLEGFANPGKLRVELPATALTG
jgi:hypothetical protein